MNKLLKIYQKCSSLPLGKYLFTKLICYKAPYFGSIKARFVELRPGYCEVYLPMRRSVTNHIGSVHAIAMCNMSELAAGTMMEASLPKTMRWIPKGMTVSYLRIAKTDLKAICKISLDDLETPGDFPMNVDVFDQNEKKVFNAVITMHLSKRK